MILLICNFFQLHETVSFRSAKIRFSLTRSDFNTIFNSLFCQHNRNNFCSSIYHDDTGGSFNIPWQIYDFLFQVGRREPVAFPKINIVLLRPPLNLPFVGDALGKGGGRIFPPLRVSCVPLPLRNKGGSPVHLAYSLAEIGVDEII
jgi:hypothetical protein